MVLLNTMYQTKGYLNSHHNNNDSQPTHQHVTRQSASTHPNCFSSSIHNCSCQRAKVGLVLYPKDVQMKNVLLLVCDQCYNYQLANGTQHSELETWYFNIYKDSKSFQFKSKFFQNEDGTFSFCNVSSNINEPFNIKERELENWEKDTIQQMVQKK